MPIRRPPPLPQSLFAPEGPLAPGSAPLPPSPSTIHPSWIIDSHSFPTINAETLLLGLPDSAPKPSLKHVVQVKIDDAGGPASMVSHHTNTFTIHPTILNLTLANPPSIANSANRAVDIIVPCTQPLSEKEWDQLDEAVSALGSTSTFSEVAENTKKEPVGRIIISGLLNPALSKSSTPLLTTQAYNLHLARLSDLSLHANVYLKALPPIVKVDKGDDKWWEDQKELLRVLRMYISPAIETFGTHRIIYGSSPVLPLSVLSGQVGEGTTLEQPIKSEEWYSILRGCVAGLGEGKEAMDDIMGKNAATVYDLVME